MLAASVAAALFAQPSYALMLGDPEIRSYLGRPLDVRIPVEGAGANAADESCFSLVTERQAGVPAIAHAQLSFEQQGGRAFLRVRSSEPVNEPAAMLGVQVRCGGGTLVRQFGLLIDPMPASMPSAPIVFAASGADATPAQATPPAAVAKVSSAAPVEAVRRPARHALAARSVHARHAAHGTSLPHMAHRGGFMLKLSGPVLDLAPSRGVSEAQRVQLREARALLDADDYTSAMLALRDRIDSLQRRLAQLQQQAEALEPPRATLAVPASAAPTSLAEPARPASPVAAATATMPSAVAVPASAPSRIPESVRFLADASWWWILVALLGIAALFLPVWRRARRRNATQYFEPRIEPEAFSSKQGVETGRFAAPPALKSPVIAPVKSPGPAPEVLADETEEAIRNARDLYNAGDRLQAAGVLRLAIESHPQRVAPWLPLFDLLMRERLVTEFAELARGFSALHGASAAWKTVQRAGQQIDPGNPLYREDAAAEHQAAA